MSKLHYNVVSFVLAMVLLAPGFYAGPLSAQYQATWPNQKDVVAIPGYFDNDNQTDIAFYRPGSTWNTIPIASSEPQGRWRGTNRQAPGWANQPGVVAVPGDFNKDGRTDIAFHRPGGPWGTVPVLLSKGNGEWASHNRPAPGWANQPGVVAIPGDFNNDGRTDIAFHRPGGPWGTVPVLLSKGNGEWASHNRPAPGWANQPGVVAIPGDFNNDGRTDIAFHRPGGPWGTVPMLLSKGNGEWASHNRPAPGWANQPGVVAISGDYNNDGRTDIAFHRPGGPWGTVPMLLSKGNGEWASHNRPAPGWANQPGVVAISGDYNNDGRTDIAFHRPGGPWGTVPMLLSKGNGEWASHNRPAPGWANQPGVVAIPGDFNNDGRSDIAFHRPGSTWGDRS